MRRILLVLAVAAMMAVMMVAMATPAFASKFLPGKFGSCGSKGISLEEDPTFPFDTDFVTSPRGTGNVQEHDCPEN